MSLTKVLTLIGDENITYQNINNSMINAKINKKHKDCEITFSSSVDVLNDGSKVGLVVWVDKEQLSGVVNKVGGDA